MKSFFILILLAYTSPIFGQATLLALDSNYAVSRGTTREKDEKLSHFVNNLEKIIHKKPQIRFYQDTLHRFSIVPQTNLILICKDSMPINGIETNLTPLYGYIITHAIGHSLSGSCCDTIPYLEFNADCLSGYLMKKLGLISNKQDLETMINDSKLEEYFYEHNRLRKFERSFALNKGMNKSKVEFAEFKAQVDQSFELFQKNKFNLEDLSYVCILDDGSKYYVGFPNHVFLKENEVYNSVGSAIALDTKYWNYWLQLKIGTTDFFMNNHNQICNTFGQIIGKIDTL
jgi:hypothetical protein